jgi:branched-chain amino acid transport system substrate-binding protein
MSKKALRAVALACALGLLAAACGSDKKTTSGSSAASSGGQAAKSLLPNKGPCDASKPKYNVGILTTIESPTLSLKDDATALDSTIKAFNGRGGIGGHCMNLTICDTKSDVNREVDCARQFVSSGIVATLSDSSSFNPQGVKEIMESAGIPRVGISPSTPDLNSTVAYPLDLGGAGATFIQVPGCTTHGLTKLGAIHVDTPQAGPLFAAMAGLLKAYNATLDFKVPVTAGTTDYQQFTLAAKNAGVQCAIIPLGQNEATQVLGAAKQLGTDLKFSGSANSFSSNDMKNLGSFAQNIYLGSSYPPARASQDRWPILADIINDVKGAGLTADTLKTAPIRSWLAAYALVTIVEKFGTPDDISKEAITKALKAAKDVDMFNMIPPWTPSFSATGGQGAFASVSNPWYYVVSFDSKGDPTVADKRINIINELGGKLDYPQPAAAGSSSSSSSSSGSSSSSSASASSSPSN